jgi:hypothetical protein
MSMVENLHGYCIHAENTNSVDYIYCATVLARRLRELMPRCSVTLVTDTNTDRNLDAIDHSAFDKIIGLPFISDAGGMTNDWQIYWASPYQHTIKLEADLWIPRDIEHWWSALSNHDLVLCTTIRDYKNVISKNKFYRRGIVDNNLVDVYSAITYFRKSALSGRFYTIARNIFENWSIWSKELAILDAQPTTDVVYSIAATIIGREQCTVPQLDFMSMIHMKRMIIGTYTDDWTEELLYERTHDSLRINTHLQLHPFHYQVKAFARELERGKTHGT